MNLKSIIPFSRSGAVRSGSDDPFAGFRQEIEQLFDNFSTRWVMPSALTGNGFLSPKVNVAETAKGLEITAELPGIEQNDIDLDITDNVVTLKAERKVEKEEKDEKKQYHLVERSYGTYLRRFALPFEADEKKAEAVFEKGVLKISVPKSAEAVRQTRKIEVKAA